MTTDERLLRIGVLADTHLPGDIPELWTEVVDAFKGVDLVLHAGDVVRPAVLDWIEERVAPVLGARGNHDRGFRDARVQEFQRLEHGSWRLVMMHDADSAQDSFRDIVRRHFQPGAPSLLVTAHSHFEWAGLRDGVIVVNPGSPTYPHQYSCRLGTVAIITIGGEGLDARVVRLGDTPGRPNPGVEYLVHATPVAIDIHVGIPRSNAPKTAVDRAALGPDPGKYGTLAR